MSETATLYFFNSGLWLRSLEVAEKVNSGKLDELAAEAKEYKTNQVNLPRIIEVVTEANELLAKLVDSKWHELPAEAQYQLKELVELQNDPEKICNSWSCLNIGDRVAVLLGSIVRRKNLITAYRISVVLLTESVFHASEGSRLVLSDADRDIIINALENPPDPSEELKLGIREFRKKYKL